MPLRIKLPSKEKIIINGAVIENAGEATTIILHNKVDILRRKEVMKEEDAVTPARRVYYALQCSYLFEHERDQYLKMCNELLHDYLDAAPSAAGIIDNVFALMETEKYYEALRRTLELIEHESERLVSVGALEGEEAAVEG